MNTLPRCSDFTALAAIRARIHSARTKLSITEELHRLSFELVVTRTSEQKPEMLNNFHRCEASVFAS